MRGSILLRADQTFYAGERPFTNRPVYWVQFLNVVFVAALVWLAYATARRIFPDQVALRLGVPLLIAAVPQDAFYGINNDALSPICFGFVFVCLVKWFFEDHPSVSLGTATGLSVAMTYLTKLSNLPLILVATGALLWWCIAQARMVKSEKKRGAACFGSRQHALSSRSCFSGFFRCNSISVAASTPRASGLTFFQGRLMSGALVSFGTLYVYGLNRLLRARSGLVLGAVGAIAIIVSVSDFLANRIAFTSSYNWFHM